MKRYIGRRFRRYTVVVNRRIFRPSSEPYVSGDTFRKYSNLTFDKGSPIQKNFDTYSMIRHHQAPSEIEVFFVDNGIDPTGLGEPTLPPISGALANAIYQTSGQRLYKQPFVQQDIKLG